MSRYKIGIVVLALTVLGAGPALSDSNHGHGDKPIVDKSGSMDMPDSGQHSGPGREEMHGMMQQMMNGQMHEMMRSMMNRNGNGMMNMMNMMNMHNGNMAQMSSMMKNSKHMREIYDTNGDGKISSDERQNGLSIDLDMFDKDKNGGLDFDEFNEMHSAHFREILVDQFQEYDEDGDGNVSEEEFVGAPTDDMN